eukprot:4860129-Prymnesium_polylepis.1
MHGPGSIGPTFATWRPRARLQLFSRLMRDADGRCGAHNDNRAKAAKSGRPPGTPQAGVAVPATVRPAPPHHPASCWRVWSPTSAASRTARPPQVQPVAPLVPRSASPHRRRPHARGQRRRSPRALAAESPRSREHDRSSAGWRRESSLPRIGSRLRLRPFSLPKETSAMQCGSAGQTVGRQQPAAVGNTQRAVGRCSAPLPAEARAEQEDVAVATSPCRPLLEISTLERSPQLERLLWPPWTEFLRTGRASRSA